MTASDELIEKFWESVPSAWFQTRTRIRRAAAEQLGLTVEQFQVLRRIRKGYESVSAIAAESRTSRPAVSKIVESLVQRGLVGRRTDERDRRHVHLTLTLAGQSALEAIYAQAETWLAGRFGALTAQERDQLLIGMELLRRTLA
jgi:DNA-binding MarR family transcriptional regulator